MAEPASSLRPTWLAGHLSQFGADPLGFLERCVREGGDFVPLRFFNRRVVLVNDPRDIEMVLATRSKQFRKTLGYRTPFMRRLFGQGLLTSENPLWTQQRRLAQPAFHRERIASYAQTIVENAAELAGSWKIPGERDVHEEVLRLTTRVVVRTLFNADVPASIARLGEASKVVLSRFSQQFSGWRMLTMLLPSPSKSQFRQVMRELDDYIFQLIRERRASGRDVGDLLSMLLLSRDEEGQGMSDQQLRDELVTLMVAGLDTTALAVSWALYLLSQDAGRQERLRAEVESACGARAPGFGDLPALPYAEAVIKESMRLYPPAWLVGREAVEDCQLKEKTIRKGTSVIMSQWLKHRDERWFESPNIFQPERWLGELEKNLPRGVYFPFGGGPRVCIGNNFAMMEAILTLAVLVRGHQFAWPGGKPVEPWPTITLQPREGIRLRINPLP